MVRGIEEKTRMEIVVDAQVKFAQLTRDSHVMPAGFAFYDTRSGKLSPYAQYLSHHIQICISYRYFIAKEVVFIPWVRKVGKRIYSKLRISINRLWPRS